MSTKTNQATARMMRAAAIVALCWVVCCSAAFGVPSSSYADELGDVEVSDVMADDAESSGGDTAADGAGAAADDVDGAEPGGIVQGGDGDVDGAARSGSASAAAANARGDQADSDGDDDSDDSKSAAASSPSDGADTKAPEVGEGDAWVAELDNIRGQIEKKLAEIEKITAEIEEMEQHASELSDDIEGLEKKIAKLGDEIADKQKERGELQEHASGLTKTMYKNRDDFSLLTVLDESDSLSDMLSRLEMRERVLDEYNSVIDEVQAKQAELEEDYKQASADKDSQEELEKELRAQKRELREKQKKLEKAVEDLRKRQDSLDVDEKVKLAEAAAKAKSVAKTFKTGELAEIEGVKWHKGYASAYGGSSDETDDPKVPTATGTMCDDWSMGVAVPMVWGPEKYYGKHVEISYGGRSIIATVVDCGGMNGGERALDLQPGVFKAFGATTCDDWGVRKVRYRFL